VQGKEGDVKKSGKGDRVTKHGAAAAVQSSPAFYHNKRFVLYVNISQRLKIMAQIQGN